MRKVRIEEFEELRESLGAGSKARTCDAPDCTADGEYRAPKSPQNLRSYRWFCLDHVRAYNRAWNYYKGLTPEEIEAQIREDTTWHRPTWPLGARVHRRHSRPEAYVDDGFGMFEDAAPDPGVGAKARRTRAPTSAEQRALRILDLDRNTDRESIKARYKELVKRHHPDANGGDKAAEDRLKAINEAYTTLKNSGAF